MGTSKNPNNFFNILKFSKIFRTISTPALTLKVTSTLQEIVLAMCQPQTGVGFILPNPSLPKNTFVSADAVHWLIANVEGVTTIIDGIAILRNMVQEKMICHASGDFNKDVVFGFNLFYVIKQDEPGKASLEIENNF